METLDDLLARLRDAAGAEFTFALTRTGQLVTSDAPRDMREVGRTRLVGAALSLGRAREVSASSLPRGELVPFGGPWPIDVSFAVAADQIIVCVVMTSKDGRAAARAAILAGLGAIEALLSPSSAVAARRADSAPVIEIRGAAPLGRETLTAIELDDMQNEGPRITVGPAPPLGRETLAAIERESDVHDAPRISVEVARILGRETLAAIDRDILLSGAPKAPPPIPPEVRRGTMPWIEVPAEDTNQEKG